MNYRAMNTQEVKDRCADICMRFSDGEAEFSTRDVSHLLSQLHIEESQNEMLVKECEDLKSKLQIYSKPLMDREEFKDELETLINRFSMENGSDTPDFILAKYIYDCMYAFNHAVAWREDYNGRKSNVFVKCPELIKDK